MRLIARGASTALFGALLALPALEQVAAPPQAVYAQAQRAQAAGHWARAEALYRQVIRQDPEAAPAYNNLGALYLQRGRDGKAARILRQGLRVAPGLAPSLALLGIAEFEQRRYSAARHELEAALRAAPHDVHAELFLANDLIRLGDLPAAARHLRHISRVQPKNQQVWYVLAKVYMQESVAALRRMTAINPHSALTHEVAGDVLGSMKNYAGAELQYKKALALAPRQPGLHYKLGEAYWDTADWSQATRQFRAELANNPHSCRARWKLGAILIQQHRSPATALADVDAALRRCPQLGGARLDRARALLMLHRGPEAIADLRAAAKASPRDATVHFLLAQAYRAAGRNGAARRQLEIFGRLQEAAAARRTHRAQQEIRAQH